MLHQHSSPIIHIKPKVLQLLLAACDVDFIKTVETILPCCKKLKSNGHVTYIKATAPPAQRMMMLSRNKLPGKIYHERYNNAGVRRFAPYTTVLDRVHNRYPPLPGMFIPPYAPITGASDNCGLCSVPGFLPPYYYTRPRTSGDHKLSTQIAKHGYTCSTSKFDFTDCKPRDSTSRDSSLDNKEDHNRTSAAATLISHSNS